MFSNTIRKKLPVSFNCQNGKKATRLLIVKPNLGTTMITCLKLLALSTSKGPHSYYVCIKNKTDVILFTNPILKNKSCLAQQTLAGIKKAEVNLEIDIRVVILIV